MAISHDGVIDRVYTNLVNYDVEENINKTAKSICELILKKQEVTFKDMIFLNLYNSFCIHRLDIKHW